jgi:hypothetical protein
MLCAWADVFALDLSGLLLPGDTIVTQSNHELLNDAGINATTGGRPADQFPRGLAPATTRRRCSRMCRKFTVKARSRR